MRPLPALLAASLALAACHTSGPLSLRYGRGHYNTAIQQTNAQQLLLNLVRLRYRDAPLFLEVTSISASLSLELGATGSAAIIPGGASSGTPGASVNYIERPTITYAPLQGARFGQQFLTPIELRDLILLYHSGWAIDRIFRVFVQRLGVLPNAPRASGPTPAAPPVYEDFFHATAVLRALWEDGRLDMGYFANETSQALVINIDPREAGSPRLATLCRLLGLPDVRTTLVFSDALRPGDYSTIALIPRSLLASMYYVSQGVEVPTRDEKSGRVTVTRDAGGDAFDWTRVTGKLMRVRHSKRAPPEAYIAVQYRGQWFWIDDADLDSKSTFSFLSQVLELQSSDVKTVGPLLTLPVAAGT